MKRRKSFLAWLVAIALVLTMSVPTQFAWATTDPTLTLDADGTAGSYTADWGTTVTATVNGGSDYTIACTVGSGAAQSVSSYTADKTEVGETVTFTATKDDAATLTESYTVTKKALTDSMVSVAADTYTYDGSQQQPKITVTDSDDITDQCYISYGNNVNAGTATAKAEAKADSLYYRGSGTVDFTINPKTITEVTVDPIADQEYTGSAITPAMTLRDQDGLALASSDYTATLKNNTAVSNDDTYPQFNTLTFGGNYTGTISIPDQKLFSIVQSTSSEFTAEFTDNASAEFTYGKKTWSDIKNAVSVKNDGNTVDSSDYSISLKDNASVEDSTKLDAGDYTLVITGTGNYSDSCTTELNFTVKPYSGELTVTSGDTPTYDGSAQEPALTVEDTNGNTLDASDYTVEYRNNINAADKGDENAPEAVVTGTGNYAGASGTMNFTISPAELTSGMISIPESQQSLVYNGAAQLAEPEVTFNGTTLVKDTDYTVALLTGSGTIENDNTNVNGALKIEITGTGNFTGTVEPDTEFAITAKDISDFTVEGLDAAYPYTGAAITPDVILKDGDTTLTLTTDYTVDYSDNINTGTATVTFTGAGNYSGTLAKTFTISQRAITNAEANSTLTYDGSSQNPGTDITVFGGTATLAAGTDYYSPVTYPESSIDAGTYDFTVTGMNNYAGLTYTGHYTIEPKSFNENNISVTVNSPGSSNAGLEFPEVTVTDTNLGTTLTEGTDYTVIVDQGTAGLGGTVTVTGKGNYTSESIEKEFTYTQKSLGSGDIDASVNGSFIYTGSNQYPADLTVTDTVNGNTVALTKDTDYYISSYTDNVDAGTAYVTITGEGDTYTGTKTIAFTIARKDISNEEVILNTLDPAQIDDMTYDPAGQDLPESISTGFEGALSFNGVTLEKDTDYTVVCMKDGQEVNSVTDAGTYQVVSKAVDNSNYTGSRELLTFKVDPADFSGTTGAIEDQVYTGSQIKPSVTVAGDYNASDYALTYGENVNVGEGYVFAEGTGNYTGGKTYTAFNITPASLSNATVELSSTEATYSGNAIEPSVESVKIGGNTIPASDYEVSYTDNTNAGTAKVTVTPKTGNVTGTATAEFTIEKTDLSNATVELSSTEATYSGNAVEPSVESVKIGGNTIPASDYEVSYTDNTNAGTAKVTVTPKTGNVTGTATAEFTIEKADLSNATVAVNNAVYTGKAVSPAVTVKLDGKALSSSDYTVAYKNNTKVGGATVTVTGTGNYTGSVSSTFVVTPAKETVKSLKAGKAKITVKAATESGAYYQIAYKIKGGKYKTVKTSNVSKTIKKLKRYKTYYVKVRAYKTVNGKTYYGLYSKVKHVKVK